MERKMSRKIGKRMSRALSGFSLQPNFGAPPGATMATLLETADSLLLSCPPIIYYGKFKPTTSVGKPDIGFPKQS